MVQDKIIIKKQRFKIKVSDESLALRLRKQVSDRMQNDFIVAMEKVFEKFNVNNYVNIDKLSIDFGKISEQDFDSSFIKIFESKLENAVQKKLSEIQDSSFNVNDIDHVKSNNDISSKVNSQNQQELEALFYYLRDGVFPWWYGKDLRKSPCEIIASLTGNDIHNLFSAISKYKDAHKNGVEKITERLFSNLTSEQAKLFLSQSTLLLENEEQISGIRNIHENVLLFTDLFSISTTDFYKCLFNYVLNSQDKLKSYFIYYFIEYLNSIYKIVPDKFNEYLANDKSDLIFSALKGVFITNKETSTVNNGILEEKENHEKMYSKYVDGKVMNYPVSKSREIPSDKAGYYIENAGLIILHPFLQSFFENAELLDDDKKFLSKAAQQKAAVLLYYLQCGSDEYKEWEMVLNKIICGIPTDDLLPNGILVSDAEKEEAKRLLQAVITYWEALKGASIEALQGTFVLRAGKVTRKENGWLVQMEHNGMDILLERLPWSYSLIKFPWLDELIYAE